MIIISFILGLLVLCLVGLIGLILFGFYQNWKHHEYFRSRNIPYIGSGYLRMFQFLSGQLSLSETEEMMYDDARKTGAPIVGFSENLMSPCYFVMDLDLTRDIYVKDFDHFVNRRKFGGGGGADDPQEFFHKMLVSLESEEWKAIRSKLSPTFTTGKIRRMFQIFDRSSQRMCQYLEKTISTSGGDYDICDAYSKFALDVIASCAFGIDSKSFEFAPGTKSEFEAMAQEFQVRFKLSTFFKFLFIMAAPRLAEKLGVKAFDVRVQNYFRNVITEVLKHRREKGERQDDFLQLMMDAQAGLLKEEEQSKETLEVMTGTSAEDSSSSNTFKTTQKFTFDDDSILANSLLFLLAGFDTLQSLLIYATYELAVEQEVQEKLFEEIRKKMEENGGKLTYEAVNEMQYLDMFINETLRLLPPATRTERRCTKDYKIPGTDVVIKEGTLVSLPVWGTQRDEKYYENPLKFKPERFTPAEKARRHPYAFSPFGHGPRNCIGMRFALTEAKAIIATLIHKVKIEPCSKTDIPPRFGNTNTLKPKNGMWLHFEVRND